MNIPNLLKGWGYSPIVVGVTRAAIGAAITAGLSAAIVALSNADWGNLAWIAPLIVLVLRSIEAQIDQTIDPAQNVTAERRALNPPAG